MEIMSRIWAAVMAAEIPAGLHLTLEIVGGAFVFALFLVVTKIIVQDLVKSRREWKLAAEIKVNPKEAYQQILNQEKLLAEFDVKEAKKQAEKRKAMVEKLVNSQGEFTKNFPFIDMETIRAHAEKRDHVNR